MAYEINDLTGLIILVLLCIPVTTSTNIDCRGKPFHCMNTTHFMICVDLGGGVSTTIDDFVIPCPPTTICDERNMFECEFPKIEVTTPPLQVISVNKQSDLSVTTSVFDGVNTALPSIETGNFNNTTAVPQTIEDITFATKWEIPEKLKQPSGIQNESSTEATIISQVSSNLNHIENNITNIEQVNNTNEKVIIKSNDKNLESTVESSIDKAVTASLTDKYKSIDTATLTNSFTDLMHNNSDIIINTTSSFETPSINTSLSIDQYTKPVSNKENITDKITTADVIYNTDKINSINNVIFTGNLSVGDMSNYNDFIHENSSDNINIKTDFNYGFTTTTDRENYTPNISENQYNLINKTVAMSVVLENTTDARILDENANFSVPEIVIVAIPKESTNVFISNDTDIKNHENFDNTTTTSENFTQIVLSDINNHTDDGVNVNITNPNYSKIIITTDKLLHNLLQNNSVEPTTFPNNNNTDILNSITSNKTNFNASFITLLDEAPNQTLTLQTNQYITNFTSNIPEILNIENIEATGNVSIDNITLTSNKENENNAVNPLNATAEIEFNTIDRIPIIDPLTVPVTEPTLTMIIMNDINLHNESSTSAKVTNLNYESSVVPTIFDEKRTNMQEKINFINNTTVQVNDTILQHTKNENMTSDKIFHNESSTGTKVVDLNYESSIFDELKKTIPDNEFVKNTKGQFNDSTIKDTKHENITPVLENVSNSTLDKTIVTEIAMNMFENIINSSENQTVRIKAADINDTTESIPINLPSTPQAIHFDAELLTDNFSNISIPCIEATQIINTNYEIEITTQQPNTLNTNENNIAVSKQDGNLSEISENVTFITPTPQNIHFDATSELLTENFSSNSNPSIEATQIVYTNYDNEITTIQPNTLNTSENIIAVTKQNGNFSDYDILNVSSLLNNTLEKIVAKIESTTVNIRQDNVKGIDISISMDFSDQGNITDQITTESGINGTSVIKIENYTDTNTSNLIDAISDNANIFTYIKTKDVTNIKLNETSPIQQELNTFDEHLSQIPIEIQSKNNKDIINSDLKRNNSSKPPLQLTSTQLGSQNKDQINTTESIVKTYLVDDSMKPTETYQKISPYSTTSDNGSITNILNKQGDHSLDSKSTNTEEINTGNNKQSVSSYSVKSDTNANNNLNNGNEISINTVSPYPLKTSIDKPSTDEKITTEITTSITNSPLAPVIVNNSFPPQSEGLVPTPTVVIDNPTSKLPLVSSTTAAEISTSILTPTTSSPEVTVSNAVWTTEYLSKQVFNQTLTDIPEFANKSKSGLNSRDVVDHVMVTEENKNMIKDFTREENVSRIETVNGTYYNYKPKNETTKNNGYNNSNSKPNINVTQQNTPSLPITTTKMDFNATNVELKTTTINKNINVNFTGIPVETIVNSSTSNDNIKFHNKTTLVGTVSPINPETKIKPYVTSTESSINISNFTTVRNKSSFNTKNETYFINPKLEMPKDSVTSNLLINNTNIFRTNSSNSFRDPNTSVSNNTLNNKLKQQPKSTDHILEKDINLNKTQTQSNILNKTNVYSFNNTTAIVKLKTDNITNKINSPAFDCTNYTRGKYADKNDCRKFYTCVGKLQPTVGICPNNTVFSEINKQCTRNLSHCVRNNQFRCLVEGRFSDFFKNNIYYICVKNGEDHFKRYKLQCQKDFHLDKATVKCIKNHDISALSASASENSKVINNESDSPKVVESTKIPLKDDFDCKVEGKYAHSDDCRKYYVCTQISNDVYRLKIKQCGSDEVYDKNKKECIESGSCES